MKFKRTALFLVVVFCAGCFTPVLMFGREKLDNFYALPGFTEFNVRDVGFEGFTSQAAITQEELSQINETFVTELRKRNWYRVHTLRPGESSDFNALSRMDAVITGEVISFRNMKPLKFGLSVSMKYLNTGQTLWSSSHIFDASAKDVVKALKYYYYKKKNLSSPLWKHNGYLVSIHKFGEFCVNMLIDTIEDGWKKESLLKKKEDEAKKRKIGGKK